MTFDMKGCMEDQMKGIKEELTGSYLRMTSLNFQNKLPFNGLVNQTMSDFNSQSLFMNLNPKISNVDMS